MIKIHYRYRDRAKPACAIKWKSNDSGKNRARQWLSEMNNKPNYVIERIEGLEGFTTLFQSKTDYTETSDERVERWSDEIQQSQSKPE
jgi:hypothetical protein